VQFEFGIRVVIEIGGRPFFVRMATTAIGAVMSIVVIVFQVTTDTFGIQLIGERIRAVAIIASQQGVTPEQLEFGVAGMIETRI
jgi:hypothetical protein